MKKYKHAQEWYENTHNILAACGLAVVLLMIVFSEAIVNAIC